MMNSSNLMINLVLSISFDANVDPCVVMEGVIDPELHINVKRRLDTTEYAAGRKYIHTLETS